MRPKDFLSLLVFLITTSNLFNGLWFFMHFVLHFVAFAAYSVGKWILPVTNDM